jgi:hypothetical protein
LRRFLSCIMIGKRFVFSPAVASTYIPIFTQSTSFQMARLFNIRPQWQKHSPHKIQLMSKRSGEPKNRLCVAYQARGNAGQTQDAFLTIYSEAFDDDITHCALASQCDLLLGLILAASNDKTPSDLQLSGAKSIFSSGKATLGNNKRRR